MVKKCLTIGIILLLVSIGFAPSLFADVENIDELNEKIVRNNFQKKFLYEIKNFVYRLKNYNENDECGCKKIDYKEDWPAPRFICIIMGARILFLMKMMQVMGSLGRIDIGMYFELKLYFLIPVFILWGCDFYRLTYIFSILEDLGFF